MISVPNVVGNFFDRKKLKKNCENDSNETYGKGQKKYNFMGEVAQIIGTKVINEYNEAYKKCMCMCTLKSV